MASREILRIRTYVNKHGFPTVCFRKCIVNILSVGFDSGFHISKTHVSMVRGNRDIFLIWLFAVDTYIMRISLSKDSNYFVNIFANSTFEKVTRAATRRDATAVATKS